MKLHIATSLRVVANHKHIPKISIVAARDVIQAQRRLWHTRISA